MCRNTAFWKAILTRIPAEICENIFLAMEYEYLSRVLGEAGGSVLLRAGVSGWAIAALGPVAAGSSPVRAITHPLGFTCLPLERAGLHGVCVHLWSPWLERVAPTTSPVHAHSWELTSYAL